MLLFYFQLWFRWALRVSISSVVLSSSLSLLITIVLYFKQGAVDFNVEVLEALMQVFIFWFPLTWSISILVVLFRSLKYVFNRCHNGYELKLYECKQRNLIDIVGYGDLVKVWRRWFMLMIWLSGIQMVLVLGFMYLFSSYHSIFEWFNIYVLFVFVLISGYLSFILLGGRCKKVKVKKC